MYIETNYYTSTIELAKDHLKYDPWRGRGFLQLTRKGIQDARTNNADGYLGYKNASQMDVVSAPSIISKSIIVSADSAGWFWVSGKLLENGSVLNLNSLVSDDPEIFKTITYYIKGSTTSNQERYKAFTQLKKDFNDAKCRNKG